MTTAKSGVFRGLQHENWYLVGGINQWCWWQGETTGEELQVGQNEQIFCQQDGGFPHHPVSKTLTFEILKFIIKTDCEQTAATV